MHMKQILVSLLVLSIFGGVFPRTAHEWRDRTVYQLLTDRFAKTNDDTTPCSDLGNYCGGTFKGIEKNLDYIQGMGFNAIWISPVQTNAPGGYHGYWYTDFYGINENFGSEQDFKDLVKACHDRDIWVMVDIVANHVGYVQDLSGIEQTENNDYSKIRPFNDPSHFNPYLIECHLAEYVYPKNQTALETCWLSWLPDLDQNNPFVRQTLLEWVSWFVKTYEIDGLRLDALRHVPLDFWEDFAKAAGVFTVGETFDDNVTYVAGYINVIDSQLNFPLSWRLNNTFLQNASMNIIATYYDEAFVAWPDINVIGNFIDNHDLPRFLYQNSDINGFKAALAFTMVSVGIPVMYYGDEQAFNGGSDPQNREPLWTSMNTEAEIYKFLRAINTFKHKTKFYELDQVQRMFDDNFYSFTRGEYFFAFTNSVGIESRVITNHPYEEGTWLCNVLESDECVQVQNGEFRITLVNKEVKILFPHKENGVESVGQKVLGKAISLWNYIANYGYSSADSSKI